MKRLGWVVAVALLPGAAAAAPSDSAAAADSLAAPDVGVVEAAEVPPAEARCWALLDAWTAADGEPSAPRDEAGRIEAEALAQVAEELLAEGDPATAAVLLEEALVLRGVALPD